MMVVTFSLSDRHLGRSFGARQPWHPGGAPLQRSGQVVRGRVSAATMAADTRKQAESFGQSSFPHSLPLDDNRGICCRYWGTLSQKWGFKSEKIRWVNNFMPVRAFMYLKIFLLLRFDSDSLSLPATYSQNKIKIK